MSLAIAARRLARVDQARRRGVGHAAMRPARALKRAPGCIVAMLVVPMAMSGSAHAASFKGSISVTTVTADTVAGEVEIREIPAGNEPPGAGAYSLLIFTRPGGETCLADLGWDPATNTLPQLGDEGPAGTTAEAGGVIGVPYLFRAPRNPRRWVADDAAIRASHVFTVTWTDGLWTGSRRACLYAARWGTLRVPLVAESALYDVPPRNSPPPSPGPSTFGGGGNSPAKLTDWEAVTNARGLLNRADSTFRGSKTRSVRILQRVNAKTVRVIAVWHYHGARYKAVIALRETPIGAGMPAYVTESLSHTRKRS
jgi:hypothetical protein